MEEDRDFSPQDPPTPLDVSQAVMLPFSPLGALGPAGHLGPPAEVEKELDLIAAAIRTFHLKPPDMVMRECSGYSARLTEMAVLVHRVESQSRLWTKIRTQQIQRFLDEVDRQWKTASRLIEVSRQDVELLRGQA